MIQISNVKFRTTALGACWLARSRWLCWALCMQQQRHSLTVEIDDLEIFGANSQSVILVVRGYELVVVATHWESVRNAMLMCEKFSPFEVSSSSGGA